MMSPEQNDLITRTGPKDACGKLMRMYWQPAALVDELQGPRPVKPVKLLGENLVLFRDEQGRHGLIERHCAHRGADLAFGRLENGGLRCAFHGWLYDVSGQCLETPAEPKDSPLCKNIMQRAYPVVEKSGILWAYLGEGEPPAFPEIDCFVAPDAYTFAFKGHINCNWLQALEVGIDPSHASFLHRFFEDEDTAGAYGKQFRGASAGSDMPMTKILREYDRPIINVEHTEYGLRLIALREIDEERTHVRVTNQLFPHGFVIPMSTEMTITQWHVPVDDENCYWYAIFTSYSEPVDKKKMRDQRLELYECPIIARARTNRTITASIRRSRRPQPLPAWAPTSTCTISGRSNRWVRSRTAPASISARPTRRSCSIAGCCGRKSKTSHPAQNRSCFSTPHTRAVSRAPPPWTASDRPGDGKPSG
jgi:nitrite reductase/ring-hydroxylating ferredoxin subunit